MGPGSCHWAPAEGPPRQAMAQQREPDDPAASGAAGSFWELGWCVERGVSRIQAQVDYGDSFIFVGC